MIFIILLLLGAELPTKYSVMLSFVYSPFDDDTTIKSQS